jgi:hypothetical protein
VQAALHSQSFVVLSKLMKAVALSYALHAETQSAALVTLVL